MSSGITYTITLCVLQFFTQFQVLYKHHPSTQPPTSPTRLPLPSLQILSLPKQREANTKHDFTKEAPVSPNSFKPWHMPQR